MLGNARMSTGRRSRKARPPRTHERSRLRSVTSSRGASSSTKRSPVVGHEQRAVAAHGLGDEEAVQLSLRGDRGGMELHELQVGERGAGLVRRASGRSRPRRAGSWCAATAQPRRRWRARLRRPGWRPTRSGLPRSDPPPPTARGAEVRSCTWIRSSAVTSSESRAVTCLPVALPPAWATRRRVWPPSRDSSSSPLGERSNEIPSRSSSRTRVGRLGAEDLGHAAAGRAAAGARACRPRWSSTVSSGSSAAARPPCAQ